MVVVHCSRAVDNEDGKCNDVSKRKEMLMEMEMGQMVVVVLRMLDFEDVDGGGNKSNC